jgi:hypothetical protein
MLFIKLFLSATLQEFHRKNADKIQEKLKDCVEKTSLKSLDRIADLLQTEDNEPEMETDATVAVEALETIKDQRGENKAPTTKKVRRKKHYVKKVLPKKDGPKRRPKHFVEF